MSEPSTQEERQMLAFYQRYDEAGRLFGSTSQLERIRTQEILERYLPPPPAVVLDVGGGPGVHSLWLARRGYEVHLVDPVPLHIEQARQAAAAQGRHPVASMEVGDARRLARADSSADAVLLLGPLYHLTGRGERLAALAEARRVLRSGALLSAAVISRFASNLDGLFRGFLDDPEFVAIARQDLATGQHRNPKNHPAYFTTTFFHHPRELTEEVQAAGFKHEASLAIEGPGWLLQNFDEHWDDPGRRERLLSVVRALEAEPSLLGASAHVMAVARKV